MSPNSKAESLIIIAVQETKRELCALSWRCFLQVFSYSPLMVTVRGQEGGTTLISLVVDRGDKTRKDLEQAVKKNQYIYSQFHWFHLQLALRRLEYLQIRILVCGP